MKSFLELIDSVKSKFDKANDLFDVFEISIKEPVSLSEINLIEQQLDLEFPETLRQIYLLECSELSFYWFLKESAAKVFGYDVNEYLPSGDILLLSPQKVLQTKKDLN